MTVITATEPAMSEPNTPRAPTPARPSRVAPGEVHVWCADLDITTETFDRLSATLAVDERNRSARFRFQRDRQHFIVAHGVLRQLLGQYLQTEPGRIGYEYQAFGKPQLSPRFGGRLNFNLSHSAGLALVAIAAESEVGVDIEYIRAQSDYAELARNFFSAAEVDQLSALPDHLYAEAFIGCWTKKEAYVKARGRGLTIPLKDFTVPLTTHPAQGAATLHATSNDIDQAMPWSVYTLRPAPGYIGALAIQGCGWRLSQWQWEMRPD